MRLDRFKAYKVTNLASGKAYIGITSRSLHKRWCDHLSAARCGSTTALSCAIRAHGPASFEIDHIATAFDFPALLDLEVQLIAQEGTYRSGYNLTRGGDGTFGFVFPEAAKEKIRAASTIAMTPERRAHLSRLAKAQMADPAMRARIAEANAAYERTPEYRAKVSALMKGRKPSAETIAKIAAALRGRSRPESVKEKLRIAQTGRQHTEESCAKMSAAHLGVPRSEKVRGALCAAMTKRASEKGRLKGAVPYRDGRRWTSVFWLDGKSHYVGLFDTEMGAHLASISSKEARLQCAS